MRSLSRTRIYKADGVQESQLCRVEVPEPRVIFISDHEASGDNEMDFDEANELAHEVRAEAILIKAHEEAEQILAAARIEAGQMRENACREGKEQGYQEGHNRAVRELQDQRNEVQKLLVDAEEDYCKRVWESEGEILKLAVEIAEVITRTTFTANQDTWIQMVREAVSRVAGANELLIRVSPQDEPVLAANIQAVREVLTESAPIRWEADPSMKPGDIWVETNIGQVDARLSQQLQTVWAALQAGMEGQ